MMGPILLALMLIGTVEGTPDPRLAGYRVAPGYTLAIAATEPTVVNPVTMTWGPDGRLYVIEWKEGRGPNDHVKALSDLDGDGVFDRVEMYMQGFDLPAGIAFWDGWTYLTLDHDVARFHDPDLDGKPDKREVVASGFGNDDSHHRVSGLTFGPDGWLYMTTGDSDCRAKGSEGSTATILRSGGVLRCKPDGSKLEVVAFGMRNPWGNVAFDDEFRMFHTDNDNEGADGFTGCRLLHVVEGGDYGWRLREGARCCQPDYERATWNGGRPGRLGRIADTGRGAPAGLCVLNSAAFPSSTRNLLVYPDVFRKLVRAYTLKAKGATFEVDREFELLASEDGLFRPTDAEIGPDGALYVLDWRTDSGGAGQLSGNGTTGRIYRLTWGGTEKEPARATLPKDRFAKLATASEAGVVDALLSDEYGLRLAACREAVRREGRDLKEFQAKRKEKGAGTPPVWATMNLRRSNLMAIAGDHRDQPDQRPIDASVMSRLQAIAAIESTGLFLYPSLLELNYAAQRDPAPRRLLLDFLGRKRPEDDRPKTNVPDGFPRAVALLEAGPDRDPEVARAYAIAIGRLAGTGRAAPGEETDPPRVRARIAAYKRARHAVYVKYGYEESERITTYMAKDRAKFAEFTKELRALQSGDEAVIPVSEDLLANLLMNMAVEASSEDPFLRDGITRGFDRLGTAGVEALVKSIRSDNAVRRSAALFALQGCRCQEAKSALVALIASKELPGGGYAESFRSLREFGDSVPPGPLVAYLRENAEADPPAAVEAIRVLKAMRSKAADAVRPILVGLLKSPSNDIRIAALNLAANVRTDEAKIVLLATLKDAARSTDERMLALSALRGYEDKTLARTLAGLYGAAKDAAFLSELLRVLATMDAQSAATFAEGALASDDAVLRGEAIALLCRKPESALKVVRLYNERKLPREDLSRVIEAVRNHATPELQAETQQMLRSTLLAAPRGAEAQRLRDFVARNGNPERGKSIFLDAKRGNCATCHRLEGTGGSVGPDLTRMWQTLSFDKRVESILEPSKEIKEGFNTFKVATRDGRVSIGLLLSNTADAVTLRDAQGREVRIPAAEIDEKGNDPQSLMPAGVVGHLSFGELADLLAFLGDQKTQESLKK